MTKEWLDKDGLQTLWNDILEKFDEESYELPTMGANVKGGAKLGQGLKVDSDTLSLGNLVESGRGAEVVTDGCAIYSVEGEGWSEQATTTGKNLLYWPQEATTGNLPVIVKDDGFSINTTKASGRWGDTVFASFSPATTIYAGQTYVLSDGGASFPRIYRFGDASHGIGNPLVTISIGANAGYNVVTPSSDITFDRMYFTVATNDEISISQSLHPQLEAGSTATSYEPYTGGAPSPSPDYPQDIEVARGRNLLQGLELGIRLDNTTLDSSNVKYASSDLIAIGGGSQIVFYGKTSHPGNANLYFKFWDSSRVIINQIGAYAPPYSTIAPSNAAYVAVVIGGNAYPETPATVKEPQLELGSTPTPYVPYGCVGLEVNAEEILRSTTWTVGSYLDSNGNTVSNPSWRYSDYVRVSGPMNANLISGVSPKLVWYDSKKTMIGYSDLGDSFEPIEGAVWFRISVSNVTYDDAASYLRYDNASTTPIPLPAKGFAASLPDGTADALAIDSAGRYEWVNKTNEIVFDGSTDETWVAETDYQTSGGITRYNVGVADIAHATTANLLSSAFIADTLPVFSTRDKAGYIALYKNGLMFLTLQYPQFSNVSHIRALLTSNPVTVLYPLATPTTEHGYIDLPALPSGATVSIPELEQIGVSWFVPGAAEIAEHVANVVSGLREDLEEAEQAIADNAADIAALGESVKWKLLGSTSYPDVGSYNTNGVTEMMFVMTFTYNGETRFASTVFPKSFLVSERRNFYLGGGYSSSSICAFVFAGASLTEFYVGNAVVNGNSVASMATIYAYGR